MASKFATFPPIQHSFRPLPRLDNPSASVYFSTHQTFLLEDALTDPRSVARQEWLENLRHADELIQVLYNIGFLKSTSQGKHWQSAQDPDYNIALAEAFVVHPVFRSYLRIG